MFYGRVKGCKGAEGGKEEKIRFPLCSNFRIPVYWKVKMYRRLVECFLESVAIVIPSF